MSDIRPSLGIEYSDKYENSKNKWFEFLKSVRELTIEQQRALVFDVATIMGLQPYVNLFISIINNFGKQ